MNTRNIVRQAQFAIACIVTSCVFSMPSARAEEVQVSGKVVDSTGKPIGGVTIMRWGRGNLLPPNPKAEQQYMEYLDKEKRNYQSLQPAEPTDAVERTTGSFRLPPSTIVDAILFYHRDYHIGVKAVPEARSGSLNLGEIVMYPMRSDHAISALSFSQIANGYAQLALLASSTDGITRKFIMYEFEKKEVVPRLEALSVPTEAPKEVISQLDEMRGRILRVFASLEGSNVGPLRERR